MLRTLMTLWEGETARRTEAVRGRYAIELIEQKLRESEKALGAATSTLATLILHERAERRLADALGARLASFEAAARKALAAGDEASARRAAEAIAELRVERAAREATLGRMAERIARLRTSVDKGQRRLVELRHGAMQARAMRREQAAQSRLGRCRPAGDPVREAEELIARALREDDPHEHARIVREVEAGAPGAAEAALREAGHMKGAAPTADDILAELAAKD